ncbi:hypothetical protein [Sphaerisporangium sp. TRM90804]|uniref:hypothetical protein n=1 Tax=Sphaerisporangium sp. TRM90804 TaxID=3031113 RepID=UPI00244A1696|nr:hypothetical protein [Sphaerisporangium sp. TRM90804]MDH2424496.1 hypothetical protein [Sphaerisporangium sp. TRM90804]
MAEHERDALGGPARRGGPPDDTPDGHAAQRGDGESAAIAYERHCERLVRLAYPPRFWETRGGEVVGTLLDLAEPGRSRPSVATVVDVLRGGWLLRLRERPPLWHWLLFRLFGKRVPYAYRWWVRDDIRGRYFVLRLFLFSWITIYVPLTLTYGSDHDVASLMARAAVWALWGAFVWVRRREHRRRLLAKHEFHPDGMPYPYALPPKGPAPTRGVA